MAPICADDMAILADGRDTMQSLVNIAVDHSCMELLSIATCEECHS